MSVVAGALVSGGLSILGGLFGRKSQKRADARNNAAAQAAAEQARENALQDIFLGGERSREAAVRGGFNPLTYLGATGGSPVIGGGAAAATFTPPLASISAITSGLRDISTVFTGEAQQEQKRQDLEMDLARVRLDSVLADLQTATAATKVAASMPKLGNQVRQSRQASVEAVADKASKNPDFFTLGEDVESMPPTEAPMLTKGKTWFGDLYYPGADGEPWGIDELMTAAVSVPFNISLRGMRAVRDKVDATVFADGPVKFKFPKISTPPIRPRRGRNPAIN